jgi:hypothetical protein
MEDMFTVSAIVRARASNNMEKISGPGPSATASETRDGMGGKGRVWRGWQERRLVRRCQLFEDRRQSV